LVEIVHCLAHLLKFRVEGLPIGVMSLVGEYRQMRQGSDSLQAKVGNFLFPFLLLGYE
jgi:hypothetical protein